MTLPALSAVVPDDVIRFWREAGADRWFAKNDAFDQQFRERFTEAHFAAARRDLDAWADTPQGALALMLLLDQFPRNCFRGTAHMYATDALARHFVRGLLERSFDHHIEPELRVFCYLPLMHSEHMPDQRLSLDLNRALGEPYARHGQGHHDIVQRFGRFPHRNRLLGRESTAEEVAFLADGGFKG